jgi:hypothetical protein
VIFTNLIGLVVGLIALAAGFALILRARHVVSTLMLVLIAAGLLAFALAMGEPTLRWPNRERVTVMVDLSPSTRGAAFRDERWLASRIQTLLGNVPHDVIRFGEGAPRETTFWPVGSKPIVLFSDAQFDLPTTAPPTYVVVDPNLEKVDNAAVVSLRVINDRAIAEVDGGTSPRTMSLSGRAPTTAPTGRSTQSVAITSPMVTAHVDGRDRWPENDSLTIRVPPPMRAEQWWIGTRRADVSWRSLEPRQLPTDAALYLNSAIIVLDNVPADALSLDQQRRLSQYVRDLGGTLVIMGGDRAFGAGGYSRTILDDLSPLASNAPSPTTHWMVLVDASGSMSAGIGATTRFRAAGEAAAQLLEHLPKADLVSVGGFARDLKWWINRRSVANIDQPIPPPEESPNGPTNLQAALEAVAQSADRSLPNELLIISDTDVQISDPAVLAARLKEARVLANVLAIGETTQNGALTQIVKATNGRLIQERDVARWPAAMQELARSAAPDLLVRGPVAIAFTGPLSFLGRRESDVLNRTWLKNDATLSATAPNNGAQIPAAGIWSIGTGRVISVATSLDLADANTIAEHFAQLPTDPRIKVTWDQGTTLRVRVDAAENGSFMNNLTPALSLIDSSSGTREHHIIPQTAPGRYEIALPAPMQPALATITVDNRLIARAAVAGHYPREFYPVGNDRRAMRELAGMSGGEVIEPSDNGPIDFHWPTRTVSLAPWLAIAGVISIAGALVAWRRS